MSKGYIQETIPYSGRSRATERGFLDLEEMARRPRVAPFDPSPFQEGEGCVMKALRIIADHAAWWMLRSLHPHDLGGCETLLVLGSLPRDPSGRETERAGFLSAWFRKERVLVVQRSTLGGLDQTEKSQKRSDCQSFGSPFGDIGQSDATQSHAGKTASQAADGFCKQMITEALAGLDVAVQAHLLTIALLGLEGEGALGAQIVARERLAQHVTRAITLRPERR